MPEPRAWSKALRLPKRGSDLRHGGHGEHMRHTVPGFAPAHIEPSQQARPSSQKGRCRSRGPLDLTSRYSGSTGRKHNSAPGNRYVQAPHIAASFCQSTMDCRWLSFLTGHRKPAKAADSQGTLSEIRQAAAAVPWRQNSSIRSGAAVAKHRHSSTGLCDAHLPSVCIADSQHSARCREAAGVVVIAKQLAV